MLANAPPSTGPAFHYLIIHGSHTLSRDDTDRELQFRQESSFFYLSGCQAPSSLVTISYLDDGKDFNESKVISKLWLPAVVEEEVMQASDTSMRMISRADSTFLGGVAFLQALQN